jgi:hypothetical protein
MEEERGESLGIDRFGSEKKEERYDNELIFFIPISSGGMTYQHPLLPLFFISFHEFHRR